MQSEYRTLLPVSLRYPLSLLHPQPLKPADQLPYIGGRRSRCSLQSPDALCIANGGRNVIAATVVGPGVRLPIASEMCFKLADDLFAGRGSARRAVEGPVRVSEMEQEPVLEAGCRDGGADFRSTLLPVLSARILLQPVPKALDFLGSLVVVEDAPDFVQIGIPIAFPLNCGRDAGRPPLPALRASDGHARKIEVADEGQEVSRLGPGSFAQDRYSWQARPRSGSSSSAARRSSP